MKLRLVKEPFDNPDYIFELKHDGFRATAYVQSGECKLISRNLRRLRFESLVKTLSKLPVNDAIIDSEVVCLDEHGVSHFNELWSRRAEPVLYAFDLLWLNGEDLRQLPLLERKQHLCELVRSAKCERILYAQHIESNGKKFLDAICSRDLEGVVAKRKTGLYKDSRVNRWLKIKNRSYSQAEGRNEMMFPPKQPPARS